jgi:hypothetical protein
MKTRTLATAILAAFAAVACAPLKTIDTKIDDDNLKAREQLAQIVKEQHEGKERFVVQDAPAIAIKPLSKAEQEIEEKKWLTSIRVTLDPAKDKTVPATAIVRMLRDKGINIVAVMPIDNYVYSGFGVTNVDAETALLVFFGAMGLDIDIDNTRRLVSIEPMRSRTWTLNLGNRQTNFSAGNANSNTSQTGNSHTGSSTTGSSGNSSSSTGVSSTGTSTGSSTTGTSTSSSNSSTGSNTVGNSITATDNLWDNLRLELQQRLTVLVPRDRSPSTGAQPIVPGMSQPQSPMMQMGMAGGAMGNVGNMDYYTPQIVGRFSVNPETGAVTVQAPRHLLKQIDDYMTKVQEMYNTSITFEGQLITITSNQNISQGIDWTAFNQVNGGKYTTVAQNNILGGAVITPASGTEAVVNALTIGATALPGAGSLFGLVSASKNFAAFNAFLSNYGQVKIKDTPLVTTTSGVPVKFDNHITRYYQQYQQQAAAGGVAGGGAVATNVIDIPYRVGMLMRLNPRYDAHTGLVRAQFSIERTMIQGYDKKINPINTGNGIQIIQTDMPILATRANDGELLLKNDDIVVVGGMTEDQEENNDSGVTGTLDTPFKNLAGQGSRKKTSTTYYLALRVVVNKK